MVDDLVEKALARWPNVPAIAGWLKLNLQGDWLLTGPVPEGLTISHPRILNFMAPAAQLGILAIAAALLMIGGEFDLSIGSMVAFAGMIFGALVVAGCLSLLVLTFAQPETLPKRGFRPP